MRKLIEPVFFILAVCIVSARTKTREVPTSATADYKTPPSNTVAEAIDETTSALNRHDSAAFWNSLTWEDRDGAAYAESVGDSTCRPASIA